MFLTALIFVGLLGGAPPVFAGLPVTYDADLKALKKNVHLGDPLGFSLYTTTDCTGEPVFSEILGAGTPEVTVEEVKPVAAKKEKPKPKKVARLRANLGVEVVGEALYLEVTGSGVEPVGDRCQVQVAAVVGTPGPQGEAGPQGPTGPEGPPGPMGEIGAQGAQGEQGPEGPSGPLGPLGAQGPAGPTGTAGPSGPIGPSGSTGPVGPEGPAGSQGPAGPVLKVFDANDREIGLYVGRGRGLAGVGDTYFVYLEALGATAIIGTHTGEIPTHYQQNAAVGAEMRIFFTGGPGGDCTGDAYLAGTSAHQFGGLFHAVIDGVERYFVGRTEFAGGPRSYTCRYENPLSDCQCFPPLTLTNPTPADEVTAGDLGFTFPLPAPLHVAPGAD